MRVRLINPFTAEIARLDTVATESTAGGKPGYDRTFREPEVKIVGGVRTSARAEKPAIQIPVQVEDRTWQALRAYDNGNSPETGIGLVAHYRDLRRLGLVDDATGKVALNVNDRLVRILDKCGRVVSLVRTPPGLYCTEVRPMSYGIGRTLNLCLLLFSERNRGARAG